MKNRLFFSAVAGLCAALFAVAVFAQDPRIVAAAGDRYVISANAGGVNYITGKVAVTRKDGTGGYLVTNDELKAGESITTASGSMAEILLNPGSYVRLGDSTTFQFVTTSLDDLKVNLQKGSAVFEVIAADDFKVTVQTPRSAIDLTRSGVFRVDVLADGSSRLAVFKGKAYAGPNGGTQVKSGNVAVLSRGSVAIAKFDRDRGDELDQWSKDRAKELTKVNSRLKRNDLRNVLLNAFNGRRWNMYNSFGLWVFDPVRRMWAFLPFGYGWGSPYGWGYDFDIWQCRLPRWVYRDWYPTGGGSTGGGGTPSVNPNEGRRARLRTPPFQRVERSERSEGGSPILRGRPGRSGSDGGSSFPTASPPPVISSPPIVTAPLPSAPPIKGKSDN
jgi:hypothetical protein